MNMFPLFAGMALYGSGALCGAWIALRWKKPPSALPDAPEAIDPWKAILAERLSAYDTLIAEARRRKGPVKHLLKAKQNAVTHALRNSK